MSCSPVDIRNLLTGRQAGGPGAVLPGDPWEPPPGVLRAPRGELRQLIKARASWAISSSLALLSAQPTDAQRPMSCSAMWVAACCALGFLAVRLCHASFQPAR